MSDRLALANAIEEAGIERSKATRIASVIFDAIHDNVATKADVQASEATLKAEFAGLRGEVRSHLTRMDTKVDRMNTGIERLSTRIDTIEQRLLIRLGGVAVVLTGIVLAALRYVVHS